jgi:peptidoglycan/xylan/chitin deacetylase (PgdA/CDA1 family)
MSNRCVVLTYHRVLDNHQLKVSNSNPSIIIDSGLFDQQIQFLKRYFNIISLDEFKQGIRTGQFPDNSCLITFDDGWLDNYVFAYPILKKYEVPATIFLATDYIGNKDSFWQEKTTGILKRAYQDRDMELLEIVDLKNILELSESNALVIIEQKIQSLKNLSEVELHGLIHRLKSLSSKYSEVSGVDKFLNWEQVGEMNNNNITFASHGCSHSIMTKITEDQLVNELEESASVINAKLGTDCKALAYPNGNYNQSMMCHVSKSYDLAFATESGAVSPSDDKYSIKRVNIHTGATKTKQVFYCKILGLM